MYVLLFEEKHDLYFEYWVADNDGTVGCFSNEYYIDFNDIRFDLDNEIPEGKFIKWYDESLDLALKEKPIINYENWLRINK